jgi:hypothetical protein
MEELREKRDRQEIKEDIPKKKFRNEELRTKREHEELIANREHEEIEESKQNEKFSWVKNLGHKLIKSIDLEVWGDVVATWTLDKNQIVISPPEMEKYYM